VTTDGVLLYHEGYDYFIAKVEEDGSLSNTGILAHEKALRTEQELAAIAKQDKEKFFAMEADNSQKRARRREPINVDSSYFPHTGSPRVLVILAEFQDTTFWDSDAKEVFKEYLEANGQPSSSVGSKSKGTVSRNYASVKYYFDDMSFGAFTPKFDVYGPVKLDNKLSYYGAGGYDRMDLFIPDVCKKADDLVDFSKYDSNNDGKVDALCVIYAGYSEATDGNSEDCIWPKSGGANYGEFDGKQIYRYMVSAERIGTPNDNINTFYINGVGVFCHEFSHCMGLPDIYPTTTTAQKNFNPAMELWDLMDGGEYKRNGWNPTEYTAWEREAMGWITVDTLTEAGTVTLKPLNQGGKAYRIMNDNDNTGHEYLMIENIQRTGWNAGAIGHKTVKDHEDKDSIVFLYLGSGMLITHIDYDENIFKVSNNNVNNTINHSRYTIIPADGELISSYARDAGLYTDDQYLESHGGDTYPGTSNVTNIQEFNMYTGTMNKPFYNIKEENGIITFDFLKSTGIKGVKEEAANDNKIYSLDGTYMGTDRSMLKKGIYIINRKKIVIK
ncbi:MAG: M6 family metalloprotease domain-containing protein, partial [Prevotella sp.]|nr:M6 family metalloprotease domain-containing protein [Prevotella sp.]